MAITVLTVNSVTERQNETSQARAEADRLEAKATQTTSFSDFEQIAQTRLASVAGVASTRFDWERFMRELALVLPEGTWVHSAGAGVTGGEGDGASADTATGTTTAAGPSATLSGCTTRHSDVARMMVRLRQLHRVTDVTLTSSTKGAEADGAAVDSCGANTAFDVTVTFSPTAPAAEAPRGTMRVPVSLGGGS